MAKKSDIGDGSFLSELVDIKFDHKLRKTTPANKLSEPLRTELKRLYKKPELRANLLACLLNGLFTEGIDKFLFSVRELASLVKADHKAKNLDRQTLNDAEFRTFKAFLIKHNVINIESDSTPFSEGKKGGKAAFCNLVEPKILEMFRASRSGQVQVEEQLIDDDGITQGQHEYEENLQVASMSPALKKEIQDKVKQRIANKKPEPPEIGEVTDPDLLEILENLKKQH